MDSSTNQQRHHSPPHTHHAAGHAPELAPHQQPHGAPSPHDHNPAPVDSHTQPQVASGWQGDLNLSSAGALANTSTDNDYYWSTNRVEFATVAVLVILSLVPFFGIGAAIGLLVFALVRKNRMAIVFGVISMLAAGGVVALSLGGALGNLNGFELRPSNETYASELGYSYRYPDALTLTYDDDINGALFEDLDSQQLSYQVYALDYDTREVVNRLNQLGPDFDRSQLWWNRIFPLQFNQQDFTVQPQSSSGDSTLYDVSIGSAFDPASQNVGDFSRMSVAVHDDDGQAVIQLLQHGSPLGLSGENQDTWITLVESFNS